MALSAFLLFFILINSCYYDNEEVLYPSFGCDTTNITYSSRISSILDYYCISCHSGPLPQGSISLASYSEVVGLEARITAAIKHTGPYPMPLNGGMLNDCTLKQWDIWVNSGMPE